MVATPQKFPQRPERSFEHFVSAGDGPGMGRRSFSGGFALSGFDDDDGLVQ